jgi:hypothetical protein
LRGKGIYGGKWDLQQKDEEKPHSDFDFDFDIFQNRLHVTNYNIKTR